MLVVHRHCPLWVYRVRHMDPEMLALVMDWYHHIHFPVHMRYMIAFPWSYMIVGTS